MFIKQIRAGKQAVKEKIIRLATPRGSCEEKRAGTPRKNKCAIFLRASFSIPRVKNSGAELWWISMFQCPIPRAVSIISRQFCLEFMKIRGLRYKASLKPLILKPSRINRPIRKPSSSVKNLIRGKRANMERTFVREKPLISLMTCLKHAVFPGESFYDSARNLPLILANPGREIFIKLAIPLGRV